MSSRLMPGVCLFSLGITFLLLAGILPKAAAEEILGQPGAATYRATVNFGALALEEERLSRDQPRVSIPAPMPRGTNVGEGLTEFMPAPPLSPMTSEDDSAGTGGGSPAAPALVSPPPAISFLALDDAAFRLPPDTHGAVGPNHLMTTLNTQVRIQDRNGTNLSTLTLDAFWRQVGVGIAFDPKILYDPYADRWIFTALGDFESANSSVLLAVSRTSDPTGLWSVYRIDADPMNLVWADYPSIGFNRDWIVVSVNMFPINSFFGGTYGVNVYAFNKANLYAGGLGRFTLMQDNSGRAFTMVPAVTYDTNLTTLYLVEVDNLLQNYSGASSQLRLSTITGDIGSERLLLGTGFVSVTNNWGSSDPVLYYGLLPQLGSFFGIDGGDTRIQNVVYRNGSLWCTHTIFLPAFNPTRAAAQWWQFTPDAQVLQFGRVDDPSGRISYAYPSIAINRCDDVLLGFSRFSLDQYASGNYAFRFSTDLANTMREDYVLKAGEAPYFKIDNNFRNRWGDYSATVVDPLNDLDMWTIQEYAATPDLTDPFDPDRWGTWWGKIDLASTQINRIEFSSSSYIVNEAPPPGFATITVLNMGGVPGSVDYFTSDGTGLAGLDYLPASGTLSFASGQFFAEFSIQILDNPDIDGDKTVNITLANPRGDTVLGCLSEAVLTIFDDEQPLPVNEAGEFNFSTYVGNQPYYTVTEYESAVIPGRSAPGALVTVVRTNGNLGRVLVDYATTDGGTAIPGIDFVPVSGTLAFDDFQMSASFVVPTRDIFVFCGLSYINVALSNPRAAPEEELERPGALKPTLGPGSASQIQISHIWYGVPYFGGGFPYTNYCVNGFSFERLHYRMDEYAGDPRTPSVASTNSIAVRLLPLGGPGSVRVVVYGNGRSLALNAGSDYATSPTAVFPNPVLQDTSLSTIVNQADHQTLDFIINFPVTTPPTTRISFSVIATNDSEAEFNEDIHAVLIQLDNNPPVNPWADVCTTTILYDDQPAGALDREWNPDNIEQSNPPYNRVPGANNVVNAVAVQSFGTNDLTILGGDFTAVNAQPRNRIARLNMNGSLDTTFAPGSGADDFVSSVLVYPFFSFQAGKVLAVGGFTSFNGYQRNGIARLMFDGTLDTTFAPGNGANAPVRGVALQSDEKILIAGDFTEYNNFNRSGFARLNDNGSLDTTFDVGAGANGTVWALGLVPDGLGGEKVLVGGDFFFINNEFRAGIAQLNPDGSVDQTFDPGGGANGTVFAMGVQTNGQIIIAGAFTEIDGRPRVRIARLNSDGSLDPSFDPGLGADDAIYTLTIQPDQKPLIGGVFTSFNGTRRIALARLRLDGTLDTSFMDTAYNQFAGVTRTFSYDPNNYINAIALQSDGNIMIGGSFTNVGGNKPYQAPAPNSYTFFTRADKRVRFNIARLLGNTTPGPGNAEFEETDYFASENNGSAAIRLIRTDGRLGTLIAVTSTEDRTAVAGEDYDNAGLTGVWPEGFYGGTPLNVGRVSRFFLDVPLFDDILQEGNEMLNLKFDEPQGRITLGGELIPLGAALGRDAATLTISDNDFDPGRFEFSSPTYVTNENSIRAFITVIRTNGSVGPVSVDYLTTTNNVAAPRAAAGLDFTPVSGTLPFPSGVTRGTFSITIADDPEVEFDENIGLILTNATGGATLPGGYPTATAYAVLSIVDDDFPPGRLNFSVGDYSCNESEGSVAITVTRTGGNVGVVSTEFQTLNGTATYPSDYIATNGVLTWNDGESVAKIFRVPLLMDGLVEGTETVDLRLFNGRKGGVLNSTLLGFRTNAFLHIQDADAFGEVAFTQPTYQADEDGGIITIAVVRRAGIAGTGTVNYSTGADTAVPGADYEETSGLLTFLPGEISKTFNIRLLDDGEPDGNKTVTLTLSNPSNIALGLISQAALTIFDNESFNEPAGSLDTLFNPNIQANGPVFSLALQLTNAVPDNRIVVAGEFTEFNQYLRNRLVRLTPDGNLDAAFDPGLGANSTIRALAVEPGGRWLIGGFFTQVLGTNRNHIARLNTDGTLDASFNPGAGADNPVYSMILQPDGKVLAGGAFATFNSIARSGIVRLNTNGTVDATFQPGSGANDVVYTVALQADGKVLIGGEFTSVNGVPRNQIARLNRDGSLDMTFSAGFTNATVRTILVQPDGRIVVGGSFTSILFRETSGLTHLVPRNYLARLNQDGSLDTGFLATGSGANSPVLALAQQIDGKLVVGGDFTRFNDVTRNRLTRLRPDGTTDPTINFGSGANGFVNTLLIQPDRKILVGGGFTEFNGLPRSGVVRIHGGSMDTPGALEFTRPEFLVGENGTNAFISVRRRFGTVGQVGVTYRTLDGTATNGIHYLGVTNTLIFPEGETQQGFFVPVRDNLVPSGDRTVQLQLVQGSYVGGAVQGPQPVATLTILDNEGVLGLTAANYSVNENVASLNAVVSVRRIGGTNSTVSVQFATTNGTATAFLDYMPTNGLLTFQPGELSKSVHIRIINDSLIEGNETFGVLLSNPNNGYQLANNAASLLIIDDDFAPGVLQFNSLTYTASESQTNVFITVIRTNGTTGIVSAKFRTVDGTALAGSDYIGTNSDLAFADGETIRTIPLRILDDSFFEPVETLDLLLSDPTGGATIGSNNPALLTIVDDDVSQIVAAGSSLVSESFTPPNNAIDPGERVTLDLSLRNIGSANTSNLIGTLLEQNGVTQILAPQQNYGALIANGPAATKRYAFTAQGNTGDLLVATLRLTDGPITNGFVDFQFTLGGSAVRTFANTNLITINDNTIATDYPSVINVANVGGYLTNMSVTLSNFSHTYPDDVDVLLAFTPLTNPTNIKHALFMSDAGGPFRVSNATLTFSDLATNTLPDLGQILSLTYRPVNYAGAGTADAFPSPAPPGPYDNSAFAAFNDLQPNGRWSLYVVDDSAGDLGSISNGWSLTVRTASRIMPSADLALATLPTPSPVLIGDTLLYTINVTNFGPASASGVLVRDWLPAGVSFLSAETTKGTWVQNQGSVTFNLGNLPKDTGAKLTFRTLPTQVGTVTNLVVVKGNETDMIPVNDASTSISVVMSHPQVLVSRQGSGLLLSWPAGAGFILQQTDDLTAPAWFDVAITPRPVGDQWTVNIPITSQTKFFRLRMP